METFYSSTLEAVANGVASLILDNNLGGKVGLSPIAWQRLLIEASRLANSCTVEDVEDRAVIVLRICGHRIVAYVDQKLDDEKIEFSERRPR